MSNISLEPLFNESVPSQTIGRAMRIVATDGYGNTLFVDSLGWEMRFDYDVRTDGQPVYAGYASPDTAEGSATWLLHKYEYDASNFITRRRVATASWTGRVAAFP